MSSAYARPRRYADAKLGISLLLEALDTAQLSLLSPMSTDRQTSHTSQVRFRDEPLQWPQLRQFRQWSLDEVAETRIGPFVWIVAVQRVQHPFKITLNLAP